MANEGHLAILKQGVETWNRWRDKNLSIEPDLTHAALEGAELRGANLSHSNLNFARLSKANMAEADLDFAELSGADLRMAMLYRCHLRGANLSGARLLNAQLAEAVLSEANIANATLKGANLSNAVLYVASFRFSDLSHCDLTDADLSDVDLSGAILDGANFAGSLMHGTILADVNLADVNGLEDVDHHGPSSLGLDTIYASKGKIPETFLRGCGVPENFITQMHSLVGAEDGIQFYSCFISYSSKDEEFARRLHGRMRDAHLRVWFAPEDIQGGQKLHEQIETAIRVYDKLLIVLSEASLQSEWVMTELRKARKAERQSGQRKLFPVRLVDMKTLQEWECIDPDTGEDLALEVRRYFIPDFSHWKEHDRFEAAFARLLKDLRAEERAK